MTARPSLPESLQTRLRVIVVERLRAQAAAEGIPFVPHSFERAVADGSMAALARLPPGQLAALSIGSTPLVAAVQASFNTAMSQLSEPQKEALRRGLDPYGASLAQAPPQPDGFGRFLVGDAVHTAGSSGARFAALRAQDDAARAAQQFAGLGLGTATVSAFTAIGLDRATFDLYRAQGFTQAHIAGAARDAQALGFQGREDIDIAVRAPSDLRSAAAAIARAKTPEEKAAAQRAYDELVKKYEQLPDSDPRKKDALKFIRRVNQQSLDRAREKGLDAHRAETDQDVAVAGPQAAKVRAKEEATAQRLTAEADAAATTDAFALDVAEAAPTQAKPVQTATAEQPEKKEAPTKPVETAAADPPPARPAQVAAAKPPSMTA